MFLTFGPGSTKRAFIILFSLKHTTLHIMHTYSDQRSSGLNSSDAGTGGSEGPPLASPTIFSSSVNPIPTGAGQIIPTYYYWPTPKFFHLPVSLNSEWQLQSLLHFKSALNLLFWLHYSLIKFWFFLLLIFIYESLFSY